MNSLFFKQLFILLLITVNIKAQTSDSIANRIIERELSIVDSFIKDNYSVPLYKISAAINFFTYLTGIPSEAIGDYGGQYLPSKNDYLRWKSWYVIHKRDLSWNKNNETIILHREIKPPKENP